MEHFKNFKLSSYFDMNVELEEIQALQDKFSEITGVACVLVDNEGAMVTNESGKCRLCRDIVRKSAIGQLNCIHGLSTNEVMGVDDHFIRKCPISGLWDAVVPLLVKGVRIGSFFIGNIRSTTSIPTSVLRIADELQMDKSDIEKAYNEISYMSESQFVGTVKLFKLFVNEIAERVYLNNKLHDTINNIRVLNSTLHHKEEKLRLTLNAIGDGVIITDAEAKIIDLNPASERMSGWNKADAIGRYVFDVFDLQGVETGFDRDGYIRNVLVDGKVHFIESNVILMSKQGICHYVADSAAPIRNNNDEIVGVVIVFSDVSKKYMAEKALRESERSKAVLIENIPGIAYRCAMDTNWSMQYVSEGCVELTGYTPHDFVNGDINYNDLILPEYRAHLWQQWQKVVAEKSFLREEYRIRTKNNKLRWVWEQGVPIFDENNQVIALEGLIIDITERKMNEEMLHDAHRLANLGHLRYSFIDEQMKGSELIPSILGIDNVRNCTLECLGQIVHPEHKFETLQYFRYKFSEQKKMFDTKFKICRLNDKVERWVHVLGKIEYSSEGAPIFISAVVQDITERRLAKEALRRSREELKMYASHLQTIREEERAFMARELHDTVSQPLLAVKMHLGMMRQMFEKSVSELNATLIRDNISQVIGSVEKTVHASRKLTTDLRSDILDIVGFVEGVRLLLVNFENAYNVQCEFVCNTNKIELTIQKSIALYRIVQEALNNVARHANASYVQLYISKTGRRLIVSIEDNGCGFDTSNERKTKSYGLLDIRERANLMDAKLEIASLVGKGTKIQIEVMT